MVMIRYDFSFCFLIQLRLLSAPDHKEQRPLRPAPHRSFLRGSNFQVLIRNMSLMLNDELLGVGLVAGGDGEEVDAVLQVANINAQSLLPFRGDVRRTEGCYFVT